MNTSPGTTPEENEARVLHFHRERLNGSVRMARVSLRKGESSLFHRHTLTRDTFYVLSGVLTVSVRDPGAAGGGPAYHLVPLPGKAEARRRRDGMVQLGLEPGEVLVIEPEVLHCAANLEEEPCSFLCIEGVGEYDFRPEPRRGPGESLLT
jgi:quercetin dioxygenase-like cupin family protein